MSGCITYDLTTCNNDCLGQKYFLRFFYDFFFNLRFLLIFIAIQIRYNLHMQPLNEWQLSKFLFSTIFCGLG